MNPDHWREIKGQSNDIPLKDGDANFLTNRAFSDCKLFVSHSYEI
jgi:hypothetical protein